MTKRYLLVLAHCHYNFRLVELHNLLDMLKIRATIHPVDADPEVWGQVLSLFVAAVCDNTCAFSQTPLLIGEFEDDASVQRLLDRMILARFAVELWGQGVTWPECFENIMTYVRGSPEVRARTSESEEERREVYVGVSVCVCVCAQMPWRAGTGMGRA